MKVVTLFFVLLGLTIGAKAQNQVSILDFQGKDIRGVKVGGVFNVKIRQGGQTEVKLDIPARYRDQLLLELNDGIVCIGFRGEIKGEKDDRFIAEIECSTLEAIGLSGAYRLEGEGNFRVPHLSVDLSGVSKVVLKEGILVDGKTKLRFSGVSQCDADMRAESLDVIMSGASKLTLRGEIARGGVVMSGTSMAAMEDCVVDSMSLSLSGASHAKVNVTERLNISGSGASKIGYRGNPRLSLNTSGVTSVSQI